MSYERLYSIIYTERRLLQVRIGIQIQRFFFVRYKSDFYKDARHICITDDKPFFRLYAACLSPSIMNFDIKMLSVVYSSSIIEFSIGKRLLSSSAAELSITVRR